MAFSIFVQFLSLILALSGLFLPTASHAQTAPDSPAYQATILSNLNASSISPVNSAYVVQEAGRNFSLQEIEGMIRSGSIATQRLRTEALHLGKPNQGVWFVFPVINNSTSDVWELNLGELKDGRYTTFTNVILYNMNTRQFLLNTENPYTRFQNINSPIPFQAPKGQTTFLILHLESGVSVPNQVTPVFSLPAYSSFSHFVDFINGLLCVTLIFSAGFYFLKSAIDGKSLSHFFMGIMWIALFAPLVITTNYLYVSWSVDYLYPVAWVFIPVMLMLSLIFNPSGRENLPVNLLAGGTGLLLIAGIVGVILLRSLPTLATTLVYGAAAVALVVICAICWGPTLIEKRKSYLSIAYTSFFFLVLLACFTIQNLDILEMSGVMLLVPEALIFSALFGAIGANIPAVADNKSEISPTLDIFIGNQISKKDSQKIAEAKEQSEHHRLMQVIEQERKLMSELQVKQAQQNEEMRRAKDAADEANRAKSAFLAIVSHEIRTPMTGIMGMLRLLQDTQLSREQRDYASTIKDSGDAMLALLNDILDFEKIESGKMDLEDISFDLRRLIRGVHTLMSGHAESKGIELVLELDPATPTWTRGDPTRLRQVLLNLINNAIKFTSKGAVYLRVRDLTGSSEDRIQRTHQIYFAVQDSGIGIGSESQKKLFMPFAQADSSISRKYGGTGLGLAICKRLIEAMGGAISINSKEGEGSTFFFTISMQEGLAQDEGTASDSAAASDRAPLEKISFKSPINVLVVDDNGINLKVVSGFVEKLGCHPMTAANGEDALDMLSRYPFDLILMDLQLPDMTGIDVTKIIRDLPLPGKANVPIVALTGNGSDEDKQACLEAGMNDFAIKPITYEKVLELLTKVDDQSYFNKTSGPIVFDYSGNDSPTPPPREDSPAPAQGGGQRTFRNGDGQEDILFSSTDTSFLHGQNLDLDDDEEDSFALAVRRFEEMEKENQSKQIFVSPAASSGTGSDTPAPSLAGENLAGENLVGESLAELGLDEDILASLRSGLSVEQIQEILVSFYEKADELIAEIGKAYLSGETVALNARAHELKGMAGNFGFSGLSRMCATVEKAAKENRPEEAKESVDFLGEAYALARSRLNLWLEKA